MREQRTMEKSLQAKVAKVTETQADDEHRKNADDDTDKPPELALNVYAAAPGKKRNG